MVRKNICIIPYLAYKHYYISFFLEVKGDLTL